MAGKNVSRIDNRSCKWQSSQRAGLNRFKPELVNQLSIVPKLVNQGSSLRRLSKLWYLSRVEARNWKPQIVYTRFTIFSPTWVCLSIWISIHAYTITNTFFALNAGVSTQIPDCYSMWYLISSKGQFSSYFHIPGRVIRQSLLSIIPKFRVKSASKL